MRMGPAGPTPVHPRSAASSQTINSVPRPSNPVFAFLMPMNDSRSLGTTMPEDTLVNDITVNLPLADVALLVSELPEPAPVRVEEFWTAADDNTSEPFAFTVSPDRWWRFTGQLAEGTPMSLRITIDGRPTSCLQLRSRARATHRKARPSCEDSSGGALPTEPPFRMGRAPGYRHQYPRKQYR